MQPSPRRLLGLSLALAAGLSLVGLGATPAAAAEGEGSISGQVTAETTGAPLAGICVKISFVYNDYLGAEVAATTTGPDGNYRIDGLSTALSHVVAFDDCAGTGYLPQWYDHRGGPERARRVRVAEGEVRTGIDASLIRGGSISGRVSEGAGAAGDVCVRASSGPQLVGTARTDADGRYLLEALYPGTFQLQFSSCSDDVYEPVFYRDQVDLEHAQPVVVAEGQAVTGIDQRMTRNGAISGTLLGADGQPMYRGCVTAYDADHREIRAAETDAEGRYRLDGPGAGDYAVQFADCYRSATRTFYDGGRTFGEATPVHVARRVETTGIDGRPVDVGRISGRVTVGGEGTIYGCMTVALASGEFVATGHTGQNGEYVIENLAPGRYRVGVESCHSFESAPFVTTAYPEEIVVAPGVTVSGIDIAATLPGVVTGTVTDFDSGAAVVNSCVIMRSRRTGVLPVQTAADGTYRVGGLRAGRYTVRFGGCHGDDYGQQWYGGVDEEHAEEIVVATGQTVSGIDARLRATGAVEGTVAGPDGVPIAGTCVQTDPDTSKARSTVTDENGHYRIEQVPAGEVAVRFCPAEELLARWYGDATTREDSTTVTVASRQTTTGIDARLPRGGSISGTLRGPEGEPARCTVQVGPETYAYSDVDGHYAISKLEAGAYRVRFRDCSSVADSQVRYFDQSLGGDPGASNAAALQVRLGENTSGDARLTRRDLVTVSGSVVDEDGVGISGICLEVLRPDGGYADTPSGSTDIEGRYTIAGVPPGNYVVRARTGCSLDPRPTRVITWYPSATAQSKAVPISVGIGSSATGIDITMRNGAVLRGTVRDAQGRPMSITNPGGYGCVRVFDAAGEVVGYGQGDENGAYEVRQLLAGSYRVEFSACLTIYDPAVTDQLPEFYDDRPDLASAIPVTVRLGELREGLDAQLERGAAMSGVLTDPHGSPLREVCVSAYRGVSGPKVAETATDDEGFYRIGALRAGDYAVRFADCGYRSNISGEWYADATTQASATPVTLAAGQVRRGINAQLSFATEPPDTVIVEPAADGAAMRPNQSFVHEARLPDGRVAPNPGFECRFDDRAWDDCSISNFAPTGLDDGPHTFEVRAMESDGRVDPTPARRTFVLDSQAPDTVVSSGPEDGSTIATRDVAFQLSGTPSGDATAFECRFDGEEWAACTSPFRASNLSDGAHRLEVRARDAAGNVDPTPSVRTFTVAAPADTTAPDTAIEGGPAEGSSIAVRSASFVLTGAPAGDVARFECRLDGAAWKACPSSFGLYDLTDGPHTLAVRAIDAAGNADQTPATRSFRVDIDSTPPDTVITSGPGNGAKVGGTTVSFGFTGAPTADTDSFQCSFDAAVWRPCTSPYTVTGLQDGWHSFSIRAVDAAGNVDRTPDYRSFDVDTSGPVDTTPPDTVITSGPPAVGVLGTGSATFGFAGTPAEDAVAFECRLDAGSWGPCSSPHTLSGLADGAHTFAVRAVDAVGNADASPATRAFTVDSSLPPDTTPPDTVISTGPADGATVAETSVVFGFAGSPVGDTAGFECRLDGGEWSACASPHPLADLGDGSHTFAVRAVDAAGNKDASPATRTFTVATGTVDPPVDPPVDPGCSPARAALAQAEGARDGAAAALTQAEQQVRTAKAKLKKAKKQGAKAKKKAAKLKKRLKSAQGAQRGAGQALADAAEAVDRARDEVAAHCP